MRRVPAPHDDAGFSLVEMVVALTIIALASVMIVGSLPRRSDESLESAAAAIEDALQDLSSQAAASGYPLGVHVEENGLYPVVWRNGEWAEATTPALRLKGDYRIGFRKTDASPEGWPEFRVDPVGVFTSGEISVRSVNSEVTIKVGPGGPEDPRA
ncbi:MAG: prepilin-type N-terminal cleavage/methylation domain-containing protein [Hyphomonas sp.]|nr:prepilin-type N-terminal cleavage/methylation domain-containing protein [Hyphomonas sp.]